MLRRDLNQFFFGLRPAAPLGLFRCCFGIIVVSWALLLIPDFRVWYTERGLFTLGMMQRYNGDRYGLNLLADFHVTDARVSGLFFAALICSAIMVAIGYKTRPASIVMWLLLTSFQHRDMIMLNGGDTLQRNLAFLLMFADSGKAISVDRLIRIARGREQASDIPLVEMWPQRLMQLQLSALYITTALSKMEGPEWQTGIALYYPLHLLDLHRFTLFGLQNAAIFLVPATYATLFSEFCMGTFIWSRRLRPYVMVLGAGLHLGIEYAMVVPLFSYTMLSCYLNFVYNEWLLDARDWVRKRIVQFELVLPPPASPSGWRQSRAAGLLAATDVFSLVAAPPQAPSNLQQRSLDSRLAFRALCRLPVTWTAVFIPPALILTALPIRSLLTIFGLTWTILAVLSLRYASIQLAAAYNASLTSTPRLPPDARSSSKTEPESLAMHTR